MRNLILSLLTIFLLNTHAAAAPASEPAQKPLEEPGAIYFTPPEGWRMAEKSQLPPNVKVMVVGKGDHVFAPSINLTIEPFQGSLKQYLKLVKAINDSRGATWQDLGTIQTRAGNADLSQVDVKTEWGDTRLLHVIIVKNSNAYILTAAALKEEFPKFYKEFFTALRSLNINKNLYEMISNPKKRADLEKTVNILKINWSQHIAANTLDSQSTQDLFNSPEFQTIYWKPFADKLAKEYKEMSPKWREQLELQTQTELLSTQK